MGLLRRFASRNDPKFYKFRLNPFPKLITETVIASGAKQSLRACQTAITETVIASEAKQFPRAGQTTITTMVIASEAKQSPQHNLIYGRRNYLSLPYFKEYDGRFIKY